MASQKEELQNRDYVTIRIASPEKIRSWSCGVVKKAETLNFRTLKPEKDGLFCEKIFGPVRDWECNCGKYKGIKFKGITCDRCGVLVTRSSVRRERMGHIELACPVTHVWFYKAVPSRLSALLQVTLRDMEKLIYYEEYIVVDPGNTPLKKNQLLSEDEYQEALIKYGGGFKSKIGAEAVRDLLKELDLATLCKKLRKDLEKANPAGTNHKKIAKRLKVLESLRHSTNQPEWMVLTVIPVIPPELRPLVPLEGGRFATSDLNDLYRRVINRNNRLKKLIDLKAPEIICRNEKRMLQEAVDALLDNGRHGRPVLGSGNRPLKSLSDMLKGKQGRFRMNLLGKRVDYSGRSVIVVGPNLKLYQCGLPKKMALELFEPFIIRKLREKGFVHTIKGAKRMVERAKIEVWDILDEFIKDHPVMLNRAPTLHRLSIQAFQQILIEGKAIKLHPLVCTAFNADFDGDQMAVHVPLSLEAQIECRLELLSVNNLFSPADGRPVISPSQDVVLGLYYLTKEEQANKEENKVFAFSGEVVIAYNDGILNIHKRIKLKLDQPVWGEEKPSLIISQEEALGEGEGKKGSGERNKPLIIETTVGRVLVNELMPKGFGFVNELLTKKKIGAVISDCYKRFGQARTVQLLDDLKDFGFHNATLAGISIGISDMTIPKEKKDIIRNSKQEVSKVEDQYRKGIITGRERYNKIIDVWTHTTETISDLVFKQMDPFNPVFIMADSGARGSRLQIRQLSGMRGLMAKPSGEIIENPITASFREGLTVLEYFISTHGARKGLADTALKTADAGYLTRRLVDVAQEVVVTVEDCGTLNGITVSAIVEGDELVVSLKERITGRVALDSIVDIVTDQKVVEAGNVITEETAEFIEHLGIEKVRIRSVLTCESKRGCCMKCYGINLATQRLVEIGEAVGTIAAQSIGEPGTQLTMRTFHIGGTAQVAEQSFFESGNEGVARLVGGNTVVAPDGGVVAMSRNLMIIVQVDGKDRESYKPPYGARLKVKDGDKVKRGQRLAEWDPYSTPIISEVGGKVRFEDLVENFSVREEADEATGISNRVVIDWRASTKGSDLRPAMSVIGNDGAYMRISNGGEARYLLPVGAILSVGDGDEIKPGEVLARMSTESAKTRDITGGLPRVAELLDRKSTRLNSSHSQISYAVFCLKKK